ncbi:hypothetical protein HYR99_26095, partial [Candidatus Poribacteria bacterium]|nr:hypothetical protein [Candidatus Poribacteria bacterium]
VRIPIEGRAGAFSYMEPPSWSPDGGRIAIGLDHQHAASGHARIRIHQIDGTTVGEILTQSQNVKQIEWSGDASYLAYVLSGNPRRDETLDKQLHIVPLNALNQARIFKHTSPSWSSPTSPPAPPLQGMGEDSPFPSTPSPSTGRAGVGGKGAGGLGEQMSKWVRSR